MPYLMIKHQQFPPPRSVLLEQCGAREAGIACSETRSQFFLIQPSLVIWLACVHVSCR